MLAGMGPEPSERAATLRLSWWLSVCLLGGLAAFAIARPLAADAYMVPRPHATGYAYSWFVVALFIPYAVALWALRDPHLSLRTVATAAALITVPLVAAPLIQSQDLYQYLFYAKMQVSHGVDPYVVRPDAFGHDPWFAYVGWHDQLSVYGPLWSLAMQGVVAASRGSLVRAVLFAKSFAVALEVITIFGLIVLVKEMPRDGSRRPALVVAAFALNPLVLSSVALSGHADIAVAAALVWAVVADRSGRTAWSAALLAAAALVKAYAAIALVAYLILLWRRAGARSAFRASAPAAALAVTASLPYWRGVTTFAGLLSIADQTSASLAGTVAKILSALFEELDLTRPVALSLLIVRLGGITLVGAVFVQLVRTGRTNADPWPSVLALSTAYLLVTPWFLPWHALGVLALACAVPSSPFATSDTVFTASCFATVGGPGLVGPIATAVARYGPPSIVYIAKRRGRVTGRMREMFPHHAQ